MYKFEDKGGRKVALRYDQTVPLARVVAQYGSPGSPQLPLPFKRYQISNVWRGENPQKGRFREFLQCDIDTVGTSSLLADAEILELVYESYKKLGLDVIIKINDRRLLSTISTKALTILDKLNKIGEEEVINELEQIGMNSEDAKKILSETRSFKASEELREIKNLAIKLGCPGDVVKFEQLLIRGLDYYTGLVMEVFLKDSDSNLSLGGGGRYDDLIGMFSGKSIPAVGFAFGFDRIIDAMEKQGLFQNLENGTKVLVTIFSPELLDRSIKVCEVLNSANINQELYVDPVARMDKQLKYADQKGIPYVVIVGPKEAESGSATVKNLKTGEQTTLPVKDLPDFLK
ncbi:MAG: histidine--tRNA ligase [Candidatus Levybacteria bacterium RIFCSPHIGHO2_01_FULL_38_96]|nr:MAG: histidine--tRNA ligase [Candidatus Levybacteria bacterium RIFCSPHIGHO2_01_FULL_38_96]